MNETNNVDGLHVRSALISSAESMGGVNHIGHLADWSDEIWQECDWMNRVRDDGCWMNQVEVCVPTAKHKDQNKLTDFQNPQHPAFKVPV